MKIKYCHTNIVASDWRSLADFYIKVFGCVPVYPERNLKGKWLDELTSLDSPEIRGIHLRLPGYDADGPTIEIFEYNRNIVSDHKAINLEGFGHIAFAVDNVEEKLEELIACGGSTVGRHVDTDIDGVGRISVVYARDPEGNIVELQKWSD